MSHDDEDGDDGRETFAIYSLGNFISNQSHLARRATMLLYVGPTKAGSGVSPTASATCR